LTVRKDAGLLLGGPASNPCMANPVTPQDVISQVHHWLSCRVNGYLGSDYGSDLKSLLHTPLSGGLAEELIAKCKQDVPILTQAPAGSINVYAISEGMDVKRIVFEVSGEVVSVTRG